MMLNEKQKIFVREYLTDMNGTQAAIRAGYSQRNADKIASQLLGKTRVREEIDKAQCERAERLNLDADWVVRNFRNLYIEALAEKDFSTAARCLENLGKHLGIFERHNHQKQKYTQADAEKLKRDLEEAGFNFERVALRSGN